MTSAIFFGSPVFFQTSRLIDARKDLLAGVAPFVVAVGEAGEEHLAGGAQLLGPGLGRVVRPRDPLLEVVEVVARRGLRGTGLRLLHDGARRPDPVLPARLAGRGGREDLALL